MGIQKIIKRTVYDIEYIYLSTDTKPTDGIVVGDKLFEKDTGRRFIYNGTTWDYDLRFPMFSFEQEIARGLVTGYRVWGKIGFKNGVTAEQDIGPWMTAPYVFPAAALTLTAISDSIEDDPVKADTDPGTGAHSITLHYLTDAYVEKSVTIALNGTAAVELADDVFRVQNCHVTTAGTGGQAAGNITLASGGITYGYIEATKTRMRQCIWTVPLGKTLYISQYSFACSEQALSKYARFTLKANYDYLTDVILQRGLYIPYSEQTLNNTPFIHKMYSPLMFPATTDITVCCYASSSAVVSCSLDGWLE